MTLPSATAALYAVAAVVRVVDDKQRRSAATIRGDAEVNTCASDDARVSDSNSQKSEGGPEPENGALFPGAPESKLKPAPKRTAGTTLEAEQRRWFDEIFWPEVWCKVDKQKAWAAFRRHVRTPEMLAKVMAAVRAQKPRILAKAAADPTSTPIYPSTWLNASRYEDEQTIASRRDDEM